MKWYVGGTISACASELTSLGGKQQKVYTMSDGSSVVSEIGQPLYSFYGLQVDRNNPVFSTSAEASAAKLRTPAGSYYGAGDVHFVDQNADGVIDDRDRVNLGSANPDFYGSIQTRLQYKNFELAANFSYSVGNKMYNAVRRSMESMSDYSNQLESAGRRWMIEGQITDIPKATYGDPLGNSQFSSRWIEDASYLRLKDITLSYNFKWMNGTTVYVSAENLFTISSYLGLDPETMYSYDSSLRGFDYGKVAQPRTFKLGFNVKL